jgi:hypothetical protein
MHSSKQDSSKCEIYAKTTNKIKKLNNQTISLKYSSDW